MCSACFIYLAAFLLSMIQQILSHEPLEDSIAMLKDGQIQYSVRPDWENQLETEAVATLTWNVEECQWKAVVSGKFNEGYSEGRQELLDFSYPSVELNESACVKILEAYEISQKLDKVAYKLHPSCLETLAGESR